MTSRDGFCWTPSDGLKPGVISPSSNISSSQVEYDVVVIGAGYCGLTAARNASLEGLKVLLLEGRDRIGDRSWSSNIGGYPFEMGGTWIMRYKMETDVEMSFDFEKGVKHFELNTPEDSVTMSHEDEDTLLASAINKFTNIDGVYGRKTIPLPHTTFHNPTSIPLDSQSALDRITEIAFTLSPHERAILEASILLCSAMCGYTYQGWIDMLITWNFRLGQSTFARKFFDEALPTKRLSYAFNNPVSSISNTPSGVQVTSQTGQTFTALRCICTIPLNVLSTISFSPPLSAGKQSAISTEHVNQTVKIHAEISNPHLRSWTGITYPYNELHYAIGDGTTPARNTHIVAFGGMNKHMHPEQDINKTRNAVSALFTPRHYANATPDIKRLVFHNWSKDEFAKGAWFFAPPGLLSAHLDDMRARHGNVLFVNSDRALGWRSFNDGAIEEGSRVGREVRGEVVGLREGRASL
ncbi:FAD/NAD(P)-binding domain-containing protein [Setomelanomma holmii]|uniref:Amine oxidase n=1 Tax=Setomelanomma holmii TaxID=210430 RepID=A0A9P4H300_9PLEO|nr:FAD/NAD(P)-binding domain-containing protein [Setomelanomma holmii]